MERWQGKVAIVTGASAGIGLAIAKALLKNGMIVIGLSRRLTKMREEMSGVYGYDKFYARSCNVTDENEVNENFKWIGQNFKTVHILVNNAGLFKTGTIEGISTDDLQVIMNTNVMGVLYCTRAAMKLMRKNDNEGHIVNINSNAGRKVPALNIPMNIYAATKHAVTALQESLVKEINGDKIRVTNISPGLVNTDIFEVANLGANWAKNSSFKILDPEDVAASVIHAISAPLHVQIWEIILKPLGQLH
ncbi:farnesol dehydrogenase-like [Trichogramma pretiosum]|uniref:farnesol dehydrogenase-like n=1 Tax=Trichogramma pretiosum TaxID=7493 RepID=UPI0006C941D4|nr:farnesol dehydrogenase-like [Trichogramma pretiosum]